MVLFDHSSEASSSVKALEGAQSLIESRFEYVTDILIGQTSYKLFRKRKPWKPI
jgi:hypothetical protein